MKALLSKPVSVDEEEDEGEAMPRAGLSAPITGGRGTKLTAAALGADDLKKQANGPGGNANDAASDGGHSAGSAASGMSGVSGVSSAMPGNGADYKRGKRYRKLAKLMDSPQAQAVLMRFKRHSLWTLVAMAALHVLCFALVIFFIASQSAALFGLSHSANLNHDLMEVSSLTPDLQPAMHLQ